MKWSPVGILAWGGPIGWAIDKVAGFVSDIATAGFELVIGGLVAWVTDAVVWVVGGVFNYFMDAQDPNVQADWFVAGDGPYATTATIGATLMVGFLLAGIAQGALQGDVGGMLRRMALDLPLSVLGIVGLVTFTQALIRLTDELSTWVMSNFQDDTADFVAVVASLSRLGGGTASSLVVFLLGLVTVLAGLALVAELAVRAALVYIVVALAPLVFAAQLWPALKGVGQKLLRLLCGLILAKLAMAVALSVAAAAAVGTGSGGEVTSLPEPEVFAEDPGGSVTQAVGILLAATAAFGVAAFMPFFVAKLLPLAEEAAVAQGLRSGPVRAAQQGMSMAYYAETIPRLAERFQSKKGPKPSRPPMATSSPSTSGRKGLNASQSRPRALPAGPSSAGALGMGARPMPSGPGSSPPGSGAGPVASGAAGAGAGGGSGAGAAAGPVGVAATAGVRAAKATKRVIQRGVQSGQRAVASASESATAGPDRGGSTHPSRLPPRASGGGDEPQPRRRPRPPRSGGAGGDRA
jgi:hypothetical protein